MVHARYKQWSSINSSCFCISKFRSLLPFLNVFLLRFSPPPRLPLSLPLRLTPVFLLISVRTSPSKRWLRVQRKSPFIFKKKETTRGREEEAATVTTAKGVDGKGGHAHSTFN